VPLPSITKRTRGGLLRSCIALVLIGLMVGAAGTMLLGKLPHFVQTAQGSIWPWSRHRGVLMHVATQDCRLHPEDFLEHKENYVGSASSDNGGLPCGYAIGASEMLNGKLMSPPFAPADDLWMSGHVFFPEQWRLPLTYSCGDHICTMGAHLWRLHSSLNKPRVTVDINIPSGSDKLQMYVFFRERDQLPGSPVRGMAKTVNYYPAGDGLRGHWQFWEFHLHLGTPGKEDGFLRFYAEGRLVDSLEHQPFLPRNAGRDWWIRYADVQSNISVSKHCTPCDKTWPRSYEWLTNELTICSGMRCRDGRKLD